jgi:hypothetical protein
MRAEIVEEALGTPRASVFPPDKNYVRLRATPEAIEQIAPAHPYLPLRKFLAAANGGESIFTRAGATIRSDLSAIVSADRAQEFAWQARIVFAGPSQLATESSRGSEVRLERTPRA